MKEILTLQFGNFANHVGTHFWNLQEFSFNYDPDAEPSEISHDILFREGKTSRNETTFTPRMLLVDLKGSLKFVPEAGTLYSNPLDMPSTSLEDDFYDDFKETLAWDPKKVEVIKQEAAEKPQLQMDLDTGEVGGSETHYNLKDTVESWPDFMFGRYHPRTINLVKSFNYCEEYSAFDTFTTGEKLWDTEYFEDDYCDKIRQYIEECDGCQGFQVFCDAFDGFSGLTYKCLEYLQDEYSKTLFTVPLFSPSVKNFQNAEENMSDSIRLINTFFTYAMFPEHTDYFVPLSTMSRVWRSVDGPRSFPHFDYEATNSYHSSAILSSFFETISLRYRLREPAVSNSLSAFCGDLNAYGRKMGGARLALPLPMNEREDLIDFLDRFDGELMQSLSPGVDVGTDRIIQSVCVRGIPKNRLKRPFSAAAKNQMKMAAYKCDSVSEMFQLYFQCNNYASLSHVSAVESPVSVKIPFPVEFFDQRIHKSGFLREFQSADQDAISNVPTMAAIQTSNDLANTLENLSQQVSRVKIRKIPRFFDAGLEMEEYKETVEKLLVFKEQYEENLHL